MEIIKKIGSDLSNDIVLKNKEVAAFQATLTMRGQNFMEIEALESSAGTFVNNQRVAGKVRLKHNDIVSFGTYIFEFEAHYPQFLSNKELSDEILDSDANIDGEAAQSYGTEKEEVLKGMKGLKRWIYSLQFPKDRQKMHRIWMLIISSVILLTFILPYISWYNEANISIVSAKSSEKLSGIYYFLELLETKVAGLPFLFLVGYLTVFLTIVVSALAAVLFFLYGIGVWRPQSVVLVKRWAFTMVVLYGLVFFAELLRYTRYWLSGIDTVGVSNRHKMWHLENLGIGFWLSLVGFVLIYRATRNGLWRPSLSRKWASLSFTFWIPFVILLAIAHQGVGLIETKIDREAFKNQFGAMGGSLFDADKMEDRYCQTAPLLTLSTYVYLIKDSEKKVSQREIQRNLGENSKLAKIKEKMDFYFKAIWIVLHLFFAVLVFQFFYRKMRGTIRLILASSSLVLSICLYFVLEGLIDLTLEQSSRSFTFFEMSVGFGVYVAIIGSLGVVGEQIYFWSKRTESKEDTESLDAPMEL